MALGLHVRWEDLRIRTALMLGLGVTAAIWAFAGYYFTARVGRLEQRAGAVNQRYRAAQDLLSDARGHVLLASVLIRDALLDTQAAGVRDVHVELDHAYDVTERSLREYVPVLDSAIEQERVARLRREVADLRAAALQVLQTDSRAIAPGLLLRRIMPKREAAIAVADELQALNRDAFLQRQLETAAIYRQIQRQIWQTLGAALAASLGVGLIAIRHAVRLENRNRLQSAADVQNRHDLQRLSARLVTAQEDERRTIARELHDEVGQILTAVKVELAVAQRAVESGAVSPRLLDDARTITERALHTVRDLSNLLHPPVLDDLGLAEAIESYLRGYRRRLGIKVELAADPDLANLSGEANVAAYRIVQEALTNVARHAQATQCRVILRTRPEGVRLSIEDDGVGFDTAAVDRPGARRGLGLLGIRERVAQLDGTVSIESQAGTGTRIVVVLPVAAAASEPVRIEDPKTEAALRPAG